MSHVALYRKYRSQTFGDLVGQEHVVRTLQNSIKQGNFSHSYLFTGPRGTGKTSTARLLAKALNCEKSTNGEPCNECEICVSITEGHCLDVIEMDAASEAGVDDVRQRIVDVVEYRPAVAKLKVFIIDEVHDLSAKAFDALLKTVEEPPAHIVFILATTELHKVPPTIQSRCQKYQFNRASLNDLIARIEHVLQAEGFEYDANAVALIAKMADGGFRDALSLLEQTLITVDGKLSVQHVIDQLGLIPDEVIDNLLIATFHHEPAKILETTDSIFRTSRDPLSILQGMLSRLAELTRSNYGIQIGGTGESTQESAMKSTATQIGADNLITFREKVAYAISDIKDVSLPRLWLESVLLGMFAPNNQPRQIAATPSVPATVAPAQVIEHAVAQPAEPKPDAVSEPATPRYEPATPTGDPLTDQAQSIWGEVVNALSASSKTAAARLQKTSVGAVNSESVTIEFNLEMERDRVVGAPKLVGAIQTEWNARRGALPELLQFELKKNDRVRAVDDPVSAVELPAEGPRLASLVEEVFKDF
ncbi:MAG: DNA polymerase III subunit gamma/tau [Armatimonadetes bacterium]|nr:DNA polymerase III subunit gamma/tau [Armatimonadota bacterium]